MGMQVLTKARRGYLTPKARVTGGREPPKWELKTNVLNHLSSHLVHDGTMQCQRDAKAVQDKRTT